MSAYAVLFQRCPFPLFPSVSFFSLFSSSPISLPLFNRMYSHVMARPEKALESFPQAGVQEASSTTGREWRRDGGGRRGQAESLIKCNCQIRVLEEKASCQIRVLAEKARGVDL